MFVSEYMFKYHFVNILFKGIFEDRCMCLNFNKEYEKFFFFKLIKQYLRYNS